MLEIQVALTNVVSTLDIMLSIIDNDIDRLTDIEKVYKAKTDVVIEKIFKNYIRSEIVDMKKDVIHCIELEHNRNTKK